MRTLGIEHLLSLLERRTFTAKMVFNEKGAIFLPVGTEHREAKAEGISYEDNYKGNALAAMVTTGRIEVRFHQAFKDAKVTAILRELLSTPELQPMKGCELTYQGRSLKL